MPLVPLEWSRWRNEGQYVEAVYNAALAAGLSPAGAELLTAQGGLEGADPDTGKMGQRVMCWNSFGVKATKGWMAAEHDWCETGTHEYVDGVKVFVPRARWRAYASIEEGVADALGVIERNHRPAYMRLLAGDASFFRALRVTHYYTAPADLYEQGGFARLARVRKLLAGVRLQRALAAWNPTVLPEEEGGIDGLIGPSTRRALRCYQLAHGLPETGQLDDATRQRLFAPLSQSA